MVKPLKVKIENNQCSKFEVQSSKFTEIVSFIVIVERIKWLFLYKYFGMKAIEFKAKIKDNQIQIPIKVQPELKSEQDKDVRVIVLIDEKEIDDSNLFKESASNQFLKGYAVSDSIYDKI